MAEDVEEEEEETEKKIAFCIFDKWLDHRNKCIGETTGETIVK